MKSFLELLVERPVLADGAMGTQLQAAGLELGGCGENWNLTHPDRVLAIQESYVEAGSDCLITQTFGASAINLERYGLADRVEAINRAGVEIARRAFGERPGYVLGDIGPFGGMLKPFGNVTVEGARDAFRQQATALVAAGVDGIIIETQTSLEELGLAIEAAREAGAACIIGSVAFEITRNGRDARTLMGVTPEKAAEFLQDSGAHIAGTNCGKEVDVAWMTRILSRYRTACDLPLMAKPNAGRPVLENGRWVYKQTPEEMAVGLGELLEAGARIVGACCGSTPAHIALFRAILDRDIASKAKPQ
ncbi:MAG TPA: homocysteine S-methyltransferase family protein [Candidatus Polarisedimenticolia bacterium]|nr:homocysteine S-methyltransferase family protein [Candidatus Polarisedimenticolia bacterium]